MGSAWEFQQSQRCVIMRKILVSSRQNTKKNQKNHWLEHIAQSRNYNMQQEVESQQQFHHFLMGQHPGLNTRSWSKTGWTLQCSNWTKRGPALKNRLVGDAEMCKGLLNRESLRANDGVKYFRDMLRPHFIKGNQNVFLYSFSQFNPARRGSVEMVKWIERFALSLKR